MKREECLRLFADRLARSGEGPEQVLLSSLDEVGRITDGLDRALEEAGYHDRDRFAVRMAVEEAVVNAVRHGHQGDPTKVVCVRFRVGRQQVLVSVEDEGAGFAPDRVPNPLAPEGLARSSGRGLFLIRAYASWVRYNVQGNRVTFCRRRSVPAATPEP